MSEGELEGVDYAFPPRPDIGQLVAAGKRFAVRYGGPGTSDKQLDPGEARALSAAGMSIVANAEGSSGGLLKGFGEGARWADLADAHFRSCGMPEGRPIYLSVDFDVNTLQWPLILAALRGAASVIGLDRVGVYGGRRAVAWARRDDVARWFWQTYAWSSGIWVPDNHMEQYQNGVQLAGADCDLNRALQPDFGQWATEGADDMLKDERLILPAETLVTGEVVPAGGNAEELDAATAMAYALRNSYVARRVSEATLAQVQDLKAGGVDVAALAAALAALLPDADQIRALIREEIDNTKLTG